MAGYVFNIKIYSPLKMRSVLTGNYHAFCHYSSNLSSISIRNIMKNIKEIKGKNSLNEKEMRAISEIVFESFEQKFLAIAPKISREKWIEKLNEILTFNQGLYFHNDTEIQGVALLTLKNFPSFYPFRKIIKHLGLFRSILFWMIFLNPVKSSKEVKLELLAVKSSTRGSGVGGKLLNYLFEYSKKNNFECISLEVVDTNPKAKKLYERLGFQTIKSVKTSRLTDKAGFTGYDIMKMDLNS